MNTMTIFTRPSIPELLVPNLTVELYFLVQLLTARGGDPAVAFESAGKISFIENNRVHAFSFLSWVDNYM